MGRTTLLHLNSILASNSGFKQTTTSSPSPTRRWSCRTTNAQTGSKAKRTESLTASSAKLLSPPHPLRSRSLQMLPSIAPPVNSGLLDQVHAASAHLDAPPALLPPSAPLADLTNSSLTGSPISASALRDQFWRVALIALSVLKTNIMIKLPLPVLIVTIELPNALPAIQEPHV